MFFKLLNKKSILPFVNPKAGKTIFYNLKGYAFLLGCILSLQGFVQTVNNEKDRNVLVKLNELHQYYIQHPNYSVEIKHTLFSSGMPNSSVEETYNGYYKTNGLFESSNLMGIVTLQNNEIRMVVDTLSKIFSISQTIKREPFSAEETKKALKMCNSYTLKKADSMDIIVLEFDKKKYPLSKLFIKIKDNRVYSLDMFHTETIESEDEKIINPNTRIEFTNYIENFNLKKNDADIGQYIEKKNDKWVTTKSYSEYKIYDLRNPTKKQ